jgi:hypothetical protein
MNYRNREFLGDRGRGLEEEYFAKLNRELIARLRAEGASEPLGANRAHPGPPMDNPVPATIDD